MQRQPNKEAAINGYRLRLKAAGFSPIPAQGKKPPLDGWQNQINIPDDAIAGWSRHYPYAANTGILTRDTPSLDIDVLIADAVAAAVALVRERFEGRGRILLRTGLAPKVLIPFRAEPFGKISIAFEPATKGAKPEKLEFLGNGQQFIAAGKHPDTKQPYIWSGGEPGQVTRQELPEITQAEAKTLIEDVAKLLAGFGYTRDDGDGEVKRTQRSATANDDDIEINPEKAIAALDAMPNDDVSEETWYRIIAAAYVAGDGDEEVYQAVKRWSQHSGKHNDNRTWGRWRAFGRKPPRDIRPDTLYWHADTTAPGWREAFVEAAFTELREQYAAEIAAAATKGARDA